MAAMLPTGAGAGGSDTAAASSGLHHSSHEGTASRFAERSKQVKRDPQHCAPVLGHGAQQGGKIGGGRPLARLLACQVHLQSLGRSLDGGGMSVSQPVGCCSANRPAGQAEERCAQRRVRQTPEQARAADHACCTAALQPRASAALPGAPSGSWPPPPPGSARKTRPRRREGCAGTCCCCTAGAGQGQRRTAATGGGVGRAGWRQSTGVMPCNEQNVALPTAQCCHSFACNHIALPADQVVVHVDNQLALAALLVSQTAGVHNRV